MNSSEKEFQRAGLLSMISAFVKSSEIDTVTRISLKQATLKILNDHPVGDKIENTTRFIIK